MRTAGRLSRGQAMIESVLALFFLLVCFFIAWDALKAFETKQFLAHAAARAARARSVGLNAFMVRKTARAAIIPVAGRSLVPASSRIDEFRRVPNYLAAEDESLARGILDYEKWHTMVLNTHVEALETRAGISVPADSDSTLARLLGTPGESRLFSAAAAIESHFPLYMDEGGK